MVACSWKIIGPIFLLMWYICRPNINKLFVILYPKLDYYYYYYIFRNNLKMQWNTVVDIPLIIHFIIIIITIIVRWRDSIWVCAYFICIIRGKKFINSGGYKNRNVHAMYSIRAHINNDTYIDTIRRAPDTLATPLCRIYVYEYMRVYTRPFGKL